MKTGVYQVIVPIKLRRSNTTAPDQPSISGTELSAVPVLTFSLTPTSKNIEMMPTVLDENLWDSGHDSQDIKLKLQLNTSKTEQLWCCTRRQSQPPCTQLRVGFHVLVISILHRFVTRAFTSTPIYLCVVP